MAFNGFQITPEFLKQLQQYIGGQNSQQLKPNQVPARFFQDPFTNSGAYKLANPSMMSGNPLLSLFGANTTPPPTQPPTPLTISYVAPAVNTPNTAPAVNTPTPPPAVNTPPTAQAVNTPNTAQTVTNVNTGTNTNTTQGNEPKEELGSTNWTGALIGAGAGIINELLGGEDEVAKLQQQWLDQMEARNQANNETIRATNSEANRRGAMLGLQDAKAGAMAQAANIGAGQALGSGLGGDISSEQIAGVKAAAPVMAAAGQFGQAEAGLMAQKANEDAQRNQALIQNQQAGTDIEKERLYLNKRKGSNWLNAIAGGTGIWKDIVDSMPKSTGTHDKKDGK
jgi:hypothetical protein